MASMKPVIFLLGPSGVGKTFVSTGLREDFSFRHFVIHEKSFEASCFPAEWDKDPGQIDFTILASIARSRLAVEQRGAVLSIPTEMVFSRQQLEAATRAGVTPVVLWGPKERCFELRRVRQTKNHGSFGKSQVKRYWQHNTRTFETYARAEYADVRVEAFQPDRSFWPREYILKLVLARTGYVLAPMPEAKARQP